MDDGRSIAGITPPQTHDSVRLDLPERLLRTGVPPASRNTDLLGHLFSVYGRLGQPLEVSFRDLVPLSPERARGAHLIHPYPAKLLLQIPHFLLRNDVLAPSGGRVLDPFCGSGTVLLEALLAGRTGIGIDSNPLACLISRVKTTPLAPDRLRRSLQRLQDRVDRVAPGSPPDVVNIEYWYHPHAIRQLSQLAGAIAQVRDAQARDFFSVCLSVTARKMSLADPRVSVPVRLKPSQYPDDHWLAPRTAKLIRQLRVRNAHRLFAEVVAQNSQRLAELPPELSGSALILQSDARTVRSAAIGMVDLVITSPPYLGAQKYVRAASLSLGWLGLVPSTQLRALEDRCLGKEHLRKAEYESVSATGLPQADEQIRAIFKRNPLRACMAANYLLDMKRSLAKARAVLRTGGNIALVSSGNSICGEEFPTHQFLRDICHELGFRERLRLVDTIRSRGLMTRRNRTASVITREWVMVFEKR